MQDLARKLDFFLKSEHDMYSGVFGRTLKNQTIFQATGVALIA